jgi:acyl-CoA hydrolase
VGLPKIGPVQEAIGKYVADMIPDGATLQIGYGGIPDAVVMQLTHKQDLGIHTEMLGDGILTLIESGAVTNRVKNVNRGKVMATFALGSRKLYDFMHRNPAVELHPSDITNDPWLAGQNDNLIAINATMQIDWPASAARRRWAGCRCPVPGDSPTSCVRPTAPKGARPSSCCPPPPGTAACRASCRR